MAHPNEELMRKGYKAFAEGDLDTIRGLFAENIVWHVGGRSQLSGDYKGIDDVFNFFGKLLGVAENLQQEIHDVIAGDDHTVVLVSTSMDVDGKHISDNGVHLYHVEDGKVTEYWGYSWDSYQFDEALPA